MASEWGTPKGRGSQGLAAPQLQQEVWGDDGHISGELVFNVPP